MALGELPVVRGGRWAVGGSACLALHGLPVVPRDLDLLADHLAAAELVDGLGNAVVSDEARWDRGDVRAVRRALAVVHGVEVEILEGVEAVGPAGHVVAATADLDHVDLFIVSGRQIPVLPLSAMHVLLDATGNRERAAMVAKALGGAEELLTSRLALRRPVRADTGAIFSIHSDPRTCVHNPSDALTTRADAELLFERWDEHWRQFGFGYWVVRWRNSEPPLGFCGVKVMRLAGSRVLNLFCRLDPPAWGHGVGSEAAAEVVRWASGRLPEYSLIARVRPQNLASQRVATHAGLIRAEHLAEPGFDGLDWIYVLPSSVTPR